MSEIKIISDTASQKSTATKMMKMLVTTVVLVLSGSCYTVENVDAAAMVESNFGSLLMKSSLPASSSFKELYDSRRRLKRTVGGPDYRAFRQYINGLRTAEYRRGYGKIVKRDSTVMLMERMDTRSTIAETIECGSCEVKKNELIVIKKPGCYPTIIPAPTCMGMCETWEVRINIYLLQKIIVNKSRFLTVRLI